MFDGIKNFFRKVGNILGIIDSLKELDEHKEIQVDTKAYNRLDTWKSLYNGFHEDFHNVKEYTLDGYCERKILSLNLPKVISHEMATLIFNERCQVSISDENFGDFIQQVLKENKFNSKFQNALEYMFAMGGMIVKPFVENGKVKLTYVTPDCFYPTQTDSVGDIKSGIFVSYISKNKYYYTLLEIHKWENGNYIVSNELYRSDNEMNIGKRVPLAEVYPELTEFVVLGDLKRPLFVYIKPNIANNFDTTSPLGISLFANSLSTIKAADLKYDSLMNEFKLGKKRIIVTEEMVKVKIDEFKGTANRMFDHNNTVYEAMKTDENADHPGIKEIDFNLRVQDHLDGINSDLELLSMQLGFSPGTFSYTAAEGLKTATEVVSANSKTFRTKQSHENEVESGITEMIEVIGDLAELYGLAVKPKEFDVTVHFDDSIIQDTDAEIDREIKLIGASLQSKVRSIAKIHGLTIEEAEQLLQEIKSEELDGEPTFEEMKKQSSLFGNEE